MFGPERVTDLLKVGPSPDRVRLRDDWREEDADRVMHYQWTGTTMFKITQQDLSEDSEIERLFESPEPSDRGDDDDDEKGDDGNDGGGFPSTIIPNTSSTGSGTGGGAPEIDVQPPDGVTTYQNPTGTGILHTAPGLQKGFIYACCP